MWISLFILAFLSITVDGYLLSKSDPICREESFLFYWKSMDQNVIKGDNPNDITSDCCVFFQVWFLVILCMIFLVWFLQLVPIVINFIEGTDRRATCCDENHKDDNQKEKKKKDKKKKKSGKSDK